MAWTPDFRKLDEDVRRQQEKQASIRGSRPSGDGTKFQTKRIDIKDGANHLRLMPSWRQPEHPLYSGMPCVGPIIDHGDVPGDTTGQRVHRCISQTYPKECQEKGVVCAIDATKDRLRREGFVKNYKEFGRSPWETTNFYFNAISFDENPPRLGWIAVRPVVYYKIEATAADWVRPYTLMPDRTPGQAKPPINVFDLYAGRNITITKTGENIGTRYEVVFDGYDTPVLASKEEEAALMEALIDLDAQYAYPPEKWISDTIKAAEGMYSYYSGRASAQHSQASPSPTPGYTLPPPTGPYQVQPPPPPQQATQSFRVSLPNQARPPAIPSMNQKPPCFGNHVPGLQICLDCMVETDCKHFRSQNPAGNPTAPQPQDVPVMLKDNLPF